MDAHFSEYLAAIKGMREMYGESSQGPTEFHDDTVPAVDAPAEVEAATGSHWDV